MRCNQHKKDLLYQCSWCGKKICELCIGRKEGNKVYCQHCHDKLKEIKRERIVARQPEEPVKPRFEDGYLVLGE
ncbi:hypothetical protein KY329_03655 [Candidatus Woesearchaeota archaeon]|nr:hypothetical protein [Candidatus Woesearchaeota archaeon]